MCCRREADVAAAQLEQQQHRQEEKLAELQQLQRKDRSRVNQLEQSREQLEQVLSAIETALAQQKDVRLVGLQAVKNQSWLWSQSLRVTLPIG